MKRLLLIGFAIVVALSTAPTSSFAIAIIDFGTGDAGPGGIITVTGPNVSGANIPLESLSTLGITVPPGGTYDLSGALAFGNDATDTNGAAAFNFNTSTGTFSVVGGVPALGIANGTTLLLGSIVSFSFTADGTGINLNVSGDTKIAALLTALGLPSDTKFAFASFELAGNSLGTGSPYRP